MTQSRYYIFKVLKTKKRNYKTSAISIGNKPREKLPRVVHAHNLDSVCEGTLSPPVAQAV
jgi:hypothetical protein